jgi:hypothetical protein
MDQGRRRSTHGGRNRLQDGFSLIDINQYVATRTLLRVSTNAVILGAVPHDFSNKFVHLMAIWLIKTSLIPGQQTLL